MNFLYFKPKSAFRIEALRVASTFAIALIANNLFNIQYGYWVMFTIAILYFAGAYHGFIINRLNRRILGIIIGLVFGVYFLTLFSYETYWYLYFSPVFFFLGFYSYFLSRENYFYLAMFLAIYFLIIVAVQTPPEQYMNLSNITFSRFACTIFAVVIIVFVDIIFLPKSTQPKLSTVPIARNILQELSVSIEAQNKDFLIGRKNRDTAWNRLFYIGAKIAALEELVRHVPNELCFVELNVERYRKLLFHFTAIRSNLENMIFISNHYAEREIKNTEILAKMHLREGTASSVPFTFGLDEARPSTSQLSKSSKGLLRTYLSEGIRVDKDSMEYLYLENLYRSIWHLSRIEYQIALIDKS